MGGDEGREPDAHPRAGGRDEPGARVDRLRSRTREEQVRLRHLSSFFLVAVSLLALRFSEGFPDTATEWAFLVVGATSAGLAGLGTSALIDWVQGGNAVATLLAALRRLGSFVLALAVLAGLVVAGSRLVPPAWQAGRVWLFGCGSAAELRVLTSVEGLAGVVAAADRFEQHVADRNQGCRTVHVTVYAAPWEDARDGLTSGWSREYLRDVGPRPDVWIPESSLQVEMVTTAIERTGGGMPLRPAGVVARSPLVVGVPVSLAEQIGLDDRVGLTWGELRRRAAEVGLRVVRPVRAGSFVGLFHTVLLYRDDQYPDEQSADRGRRLRGIEQMLAQGQDDGDFPLGDSDALLCRQRERRTALPATAVLTTERALAHYNRGGALGARCPHEQELVPQLIAFYPKDVPSLDHPVVRLDWAQPADEGAAERERVARDLVQWLGSEEAKDVLLEAGLRPPGYPIGAPLTEQHGLHSGARFTPGPPHVDELTRVLRDHERARRPSRVLLALDTSGSMAQEVNRAGDTRVDIAADGVRQALALLGPRDEFWLWAFPAGRDSPEPASAVPVGRRETLLNGTTRRDLVTRALREVRPEGDTPLFATIAQGVAEIGDHETVQAGHRDHLDALVVLTDGENTLAGPTPRQLGNLAEDTHVRIFVVAVGEARCDGTIRGITRPSGGECYDSSFAALSSDVTDLFQRLWEGMRRGP